MQITDGIQTAIFLRIFINFRFCECGITPKIFSVLPVLVSLDYWFKNFSAPIGAMDITGVNHYSFTITELIESEQQVKTGATKVAIIS